MKNENKMGLFRCKKYTNPTGKVDGSTRDLWVKSGEVLGSDL